MELVSALVHSLRSPTRAPRWQKRPCRVLEFVASFGHDAALGVVAFWRESRIHATLPSREHSANLSLTRDSYSFNSFATKFGTVPPSQSE